MNTTNIIIIVCLTAFTLIHAQPSTNFGVNCTWMQGSNSYNQLPTYGVPGAFSSEPYPGGRAGHCAATVTTASGSEMFLTYGGSLTGTSGDLWAWDITNSLWAMIHSTQPRNFGSNGAFSPSVSPGQYFGHVCTSLPNRFYLFSGHCVCGQSGTGNFLWQFDTTLLQWRFVTAGTFSTNGDPYCYTGKNIEDPRNIPAGRYAGSIDSMVEMNSLVIFSGWSYTPSIMGTINDLWRFNATSEQWAWLSGNYTTANTPPVYAQLGVASPYNLPMSHFGTSIAYVPETRQLIVFGGIGSADTNMFDFNTQMWTIYSFGYGRGLYSTPQYPGDRFGHTMVTIPGTKLVAMTHGNGRGNLAFYIGSLAISDIWILNTTSFIWYWLRGEESFTSIGNYGTKGVTSNVPLPPRRAGQTLSYSTSLNRFILFGGGVVNGSADDLWYLDFGFKSVVSQSASSTLTSILSTTSLAVTTTVTTNARTTNIAKPEATSKPLQVNDDFFSQNSSTILFVIVGAVALVVVTVSCCLCRMFVNRNKNNRETEMSTFPTTTYTTESTTVSSSTTTMLNIQTAMAIPGYLKYRAGAEFRWHKKIAKGGGGEVFLGDALIPGLAVYGQTIIVKIVALDQSLISQRTADAFDQEISVMHYLGRHANIAGLLGWCDKPLAMLMKYYVNGALSSFLQNGCVTNTFLKLHFMLDIARGLQFMHARSVAHCDIKPQNVLVDEDQNGRLFCALTDFGIARLYTDQTQLVQAFKIVNLRGLSIHYAAPEVLKNFRGKVNATQEMAFAGDVYSFAMVTSYVMIGYSYWD